MGHLHLILARATVTDTLSQRDRAPRFHVPEIVSTGAMLCVLIAPLALAPRPVAGVYLLGWLAWAGWSS